MANKKNNKGFKLNLYWMYAIIVGGLLAAWFFGSNVATKPMSMTEFEKMVKSGGVSKTRWHVWCSRTRTINLGKVCRPRQRPIFLRATSSPR